jgi:hypothetical protein
MGAWDYIKNSGKCNADNWELEFLGFLPGKRESRRMMGEYVITQPDVTSGKVFEDTVAYGGWPLDDHFPAGYYHKGRPNTNFKTPSPYCLPYRALYSKNVENLFFAGRNISMTHMAMSSIRVMATCALLGEAVGKAAAIATRNGITPHAVYLKKIYELQSALLNEDCFLPNVSRSISETCSKAKLNVASDVLRDGCDRAHRLYHNDREGSAYLAKVGERLKYSFEPMTVKSAHIVFDSDLNRRTLPGSACEREHSMRANQRLDSPQMHMPLTLCKEFTLYGERSGKRIVLLQIEDNRKRAYHVSIDQELDALILVPKSTWGEKGDIPIISFDFE